MSDPAASPTADEEADPDNARNHHAGMLWAAIGGKRAGPASVKTRGPHTAAVTPTVMR